MDRRTIALGVLASGIVLSVLGVLGHTWLHTDTGAIRFGLRSIEACQHGSCERRSLTETPVDDLFSMSGNVAFFGALIASGLGAVAGALSLSRTELNAPVSPARLSIAFFAAAAVAGGVFLATWPEGLGLELHVGRAAFFGIGGSLLGAAGAIALYRHEQLTAREAAARTNTFA